MGGRCWNGQWEPCCCVEAYGKGWRPDWKVLPESQSVDAEFRVAADVILLVSAMEGKQEARIWPR